jgi:hypothetical protein
MGYSSHSRAFWVLNLDTNLVMETCEVTFDETQPCNSSVFECAGDDEVGKKIFEDEEDDAGEDDGEAPATRVPSTSTTTTTVRGGPSPTPPTIQQDQVEEAAEGEVASRREVPSRVQVDHAPSVIISDINERTTRSRGYEKKIRDVYDGRIAVLSQASDQAGEGRNICTSRQVHEGHPQEVQDGRFEAPVDTDEYDYNA